MHDDSAPARRRIWIGATTKQAPPHQTLYADAKGTDIDPGEYKGPYRRLDDDGSDLIIDRHSVFPDHDIY